MIKVGKLMPFQSRKIRSKLNLLHMTLYGNKNEWDRNMQKHVKHFWFNNNTAQVREDIPLKFIVAWRLRVIWNQMKGRGEGWRSLWEYAVPQGRKGIACKYCTCLHIAKEANREGCGRVAGWRDPSMETKGKGNYQWQEEWIDALSRSKKRLIEKLLWCWWMFMVEGNLVCSSTQRRSHEDPTTDLAILRQKSLEADHRQVIHEELRSLV